MKRRRLGHLVKQAVDEGVYKVAKVFFKETKELFGWIIKEAILKAFGATGTWPANSVGDVEVLVAAAFPTPLPQGAPPDDSDLGWTVSMAVIC